MNFNRRHFLRSASLLAATSFSDMDILAARLQAKTNGKTIQPDDEKYWSNIRTLFPLSTESIYFNNGTLGPSPYPVIEAVKEGMMQTEVYGDYHGYEDSVKEIAKFIKAGEDEVVLTHNVTEGINIACWGLPLRRGDEVILTTHEHVGNALPWLNRQKLHGIVIKTFAPAKTAADTLNRINTLITKRTRVIAVPHMPCTQGQVFPVKEICTLAREKGIYSCIDGAHGLGMMPLDMHDMGCDTYATCGHKWLLGPKGTGFLYIRKDMQAELQPYFMGAGGIAGDWDVRSFPATMSVYAESAHRYYGGTQSLALSRGVIAAADFLNDIGMDNVHNRVKYLGAYTLEKLRNFDDKIKLVTPSEERSRCAVTAFRLRDMDYKSFYKMSLEANIRIREVPENGIHCLRVSTHIYNAPVEIDRLMDLVGKAVAG